MIKNYKNKYFNKLLLKYKINENIKSKQIRLVDNKLFENKIYDTKYLLNKIKKKNLKLDIIEINNKIYPSIVKVINFNKFIYEYKKKIKKKIINQKKNKLKLIQLSTNISEHDKNYKIKNIKKFFLKGNKVILYIFFKGRSIIYKDQGEKTLIDISKKLKNYGFILKYPYMDKRKMLMIMLPIKK